MKTLAGALAALILTAACAKAQDDGSAGPEAQPAPTALFTIVTSADAQTQLMALTLTRASIETGMDARVLLCGPAGDIALADPPAAATAPQGPMGGSPHGLLASLIEDGVTVQVCATYLPNSTYGSDDLLDGVGSARPPEIAAVMAAPQTRLFTF